MLHNYRYGLKFVFALTTVFSVLVSTAFAEPEPSGATLSGFVKDAESEETLIGATVYVKEAKKGTYTNKAGFFSVTGIPAGTHTVVVSMIGYEKLEKSISFYGSGSIRESFELKTQAITTQEVSVEATREVEKRQITVSKVNIPVKTIKEIRIGGESDVMRSLQMLPGVLTSSQISSGLYVRGSSPDQNLVLLDGTNVYNPSHIFGFISTFNSDAVKDVELIKGGYPAEYGGRLASVLNITQKDGNRDKIEGIGSVGVISSKLAVEGPGPIGKSSWFIGGRRTYFDLIKGILSEDPENPIPDFNFYDLNAKYAHDITDNDKIFVSGFLSEDMFHFGSTGLDVDLGIDNRLASARWTHIYGDNMFSNLNFSGSRYSNNFTIDQSGYEILIDNSIADYTLKGGLEWYMSEDLTSKFGFEVNTYNFRYTQNWTGDTDSTTTGSSAGELNLRVHDWNYSVYGQVNYNWWEILSFQAGLRVNYWDMSRTDTYDPRLAVRYQMSDKFALKASWGMYHQNLRLMSQDDFAFFDTWLPTDKTVPAQRAIHYILSAESSFLEGYDINLDVYYKTLENISEPNPYAIEGSEVKDVFYIGKGLAYGAEIFMQRKVGKFVGWAGYAFGWVEAEFDSIDQGDPFHPKFDRRHDFKIVVQYNHNEHWEFGANFLFQSGQGYTGATSRFQMLNPGMNYGVGKVVPSEYYGLKLPPSHQLNMNASYKFKTFKKPSRLILDIYNVYNRKDIWFRFYDTTEEVTTVEDVTLIPILPTISYEIKF